MVIKSYLYLNPNEKKKFDSSNEWVTSDEISFTLTDDLMKVFTNK